MADFDSCHTGYEHDSAFNHGMLKVSDIHNLSYEEYGNKHGKPVIFLHGGPGGRTSHANTIYFNPLVYRVVLLDQRGSGKSTPSACIIDNTSQHLVSDIETLRHHLLIPKWHLVFGGSWGSTLALLYAQAHPSRVGSLVLRGILLFRRCESDWINYSLAPHIFPETYQHLIDHIPQEERGDLANAYYKRLMSDDRMTRYKAALMWNMWGASIATLDYDSGNQLANMTDTESLIAHASLEAHYAVNRGFMEEGQLLKKENIERMRNIPGFIVNGRYDLVTPCQNAFDLYTAWPEAAIFIIPRAGHSAKVCSQTLAKTYV